MSKPDCFGVAGGVNAAHSVNDAIGQTFQVCVGRPVENMGDSWCVFTPVNVTF